MALQRRLVSRRYPYLPVRFSLGHQSFQGEALLDTGFDGHLAVPVSFLDQIEAVPADHYLRWELADSSTVRSPAYRSLVQLDGLGPFPAFVMVLGSKILWAWPSSAPSASPWTAVVGLSPSYCE